MKDHLDRSEHGGKTESMVARSRGLYRKKYSDSWRPGHCNEYCRRSFEYLLGETGFELVVWETYSYRPFSNFVFNHWHIGNKARVIVWKNSEQKHCQDESNSGMKRGGAVQ